MIRISEVVSGSARRFFWDVDVEALDPSQHEDYVFGRILSVGDWQAVRALREAVGDEALRAFLVRAPERLDARSRRFFAIALG